MKKTLVLSVVLLLFVIGILVGLETRYRSEEEEDFVVLADKVGSPPVMVIFRENPDGRTTREPGWCYGSDNFENKWDMSVFEAAKKGDVLLRQHHTNYFYLFGRKIFRQHEDWFLPQDSAPPWKPEIKDYWPFHHPLSLQH